MLSLPIYVPVLPTIVFVALPTIPKSVVIASHRAFGAPVNLLLLLAFTPVLALLALGFPRRLQPPLRLLPLLLSSPVLKSAMAVSAISPVTPLVKLVK